MSSVEPTDTDIAAFDRIARIVAWTGLPGAHTDQNAPWGSLMHTLGVDPAMHPRVIATIPPEDYTNILQSWTIAGNPPTPAQRAMADMLGRACRVTSGDQFYRADALAQAHARTVHDLAVLQAQPAISSGGASSSTSIP